MDSQRSTPFLITLVAAAAVLFPMRAAMRTPAKNSPETAAAKSEREAHAEPPAGGEFPTAKDLVSEFLAVGPADQAASSGHPMDAPNGIEFLIATAPDPVSSRLPHFFDSFVESLESATEASGYSLDRFAFPWREKGEATHDEAPSWRPTLYESAPGLILFRNPSKQTLLLVFLVGETPTTGIHKPALLSALDQMAQFYPWDPKHAELPTAFPPVLLGARPPSAGGAPGASLASADLKAGATPPVPPPAGDTIRIMGPAFSGSAESLRRVLDKWSESRGNSAHVQFTIISGTATAIDAPWLAQAAQGHTSFQATVPPDSSTGLAIACYIGGLGYDKIAVLTEGNTAYGQNFTSQTASGKTSSGAKMGGCGNGPGVPEILSLPFPMHISRLRAASNKAPQPPASTETETVSSQPSPSSLAQESAAEPREVLPSYSALSVQSAELTLSNLLATIDREQYKFVGIVATDVRDVTFLAREVRKHAPATILFTLNSDLLYAYPDVNSATHGMMVVTPYPLFNLEQLWTYSYGGGKSRLQFTNQAAEGVYNATLALLHQDDKLVDYGRPLGISQPAPAGELRKPSLWLTTIGNQETLPVRLLEWKDDAQYTYAPGASKSGNKRKGEPSVGRGIYAENSVLVVVILSVFILAFSLLIILQYGWPAKNAVNRISDIVGDTASPAYWSECRLFLLCGSASLLAFYMIVVTAFFLPFVAGWQLGRSVETSGTPRVAAALGILTLLLLLLATHVLVSALRQAPANQRGSAPEVVLVALFGCALIIVQAGLLDFLWVLQVRADPANGLFAHLRYFDLSGGLTPLLPISCVAVGAFMWAVCSFRRLHLLDILRAAGTVERPQAWLNFLGFDIRSFRGVRELENSVKHILESSTVMSLKWYGLIMALLLNVWLYFFYHRLVRALEVRPFYWLFGAAFFIVYWALLMEFLRLIFAWRSLHLLLQRLSWHPLLAAFKRYRESRPNLVRMNLTHPPSSFAALESSVSQAGRLLRTAKKLVAAPEVAPEMRELLQQSIPDWEAQIHAAGSHLCDALGVEWTDPSATSLEDAARKKRATRILSNWRQSLLSRSHAHSALFRVSQSLGKVMERDWSCHQPEGAANPENAAAKEFFAQGEEFIVSRVVNFLAIVFPSLQNLGYFVLAGLLLMLLSVTSYPFQPRNEFLFFNWVVILSFVGVVFWIFIQMDRDTVLSLLNDTAPGQITFSRGLMIRTLLYVAVPLLALLGAQFPESLRQVLALFTAAPGTP